MHQMGYTSCKADSNLWLKAVTGPEDNVLYYAYILCYVNDILCIHDDPMSVMNEINGYLPLKPSSVGDPDIYLGAKLKLTQLPNGVMAWGLSPSKYVIQAVKNCQLHLTDKLNWKYAIPKLQPSGDIQQGCHRALTTMTDQAMVIDQKLLSATTKKAKNCIHLRRNYSGTAPPPNHTMHLHHGG
jgi:hypothetical protein